MCVCVCVRACDGEREEGGMENVVRRIVDKRVFEAADRTNSHRVYHVLRVATCHFHVLRGGVAVWGCPGQLRLSCVSLPLPHPPPSLSLLPGKLACDEACAHIIRFKPNYPV